MSKPDDAGVAPADCALGDLDGPRSLAHRGDEDLHDDRVAGLGGALAAQAEALEVRFDDLVEGQALLGRELRGVAHLGVGDAVGGEVLGAFGGDPDDRVAILEDADRVLEGLEVQLERLAIRAAPEPGRQLVDVGRRQAAVAELAREVDDGRGPQSAVEVVVEQRLGRLSNGLEGQHRFAGWYARHGTSRSPPRRSRRRAIERDGTAAISRRCRPRRGR